MLLALTIVRDRSVDRVAAKMDKGLPRQDTEIMHFACIFEGAADGKMFAVQAV
jgi:hypothetical protein